jgi:glucose-1-phosphate cytidylyltransferase
MKAVILAGGLGTRLSEETVSRPKPMVEIGGKPILWHIMKMYSAHGINDFIICCGYKGYFIKEYFANYFLHMSDVTFDMRSNAMNVHHKRAEPWTVTLVDTGEASMTGGRLGRVRDYLDEDAFCFTYGDGVGDIDIGQSIAFHRAHGRQATLTAAYPPGRFGALDIQEGKVRSFQEKPKGDGAMINAGFFVLSPAVLRLIEDDSTVWEDSPLIRLAEQGELMAYEHTGFWQPMDTLRDKVHLEELWQAGKAPWKMWGSHAAA